MKEPFSFYNFSSGIKFYLVNCGSGLTHIIVFPDGTVMLYDCNLVDDEEHTERNKEYVLDRLKEIIPKRINDDGDKEQWIDIFVNSHRDTDHLRGLKDVNEAFPIHSIWDSGQCGASTEDSNYQYYMNLRRQLKHESKDNLVVPKPSEGIFRSIGGADIYVLSDANDFIAKDSMIYESADKIQHTNCLVLLIYYAGRKLLLTGDSDWLAWRDNVVPNFKNSEVNIKDIDILIASHHGSRTFFTNKEVIDEKKYPDDTYVESIEIMRPKVTLISCGDYDTYHHPSKDALKLYLSNTAGNQVFTTNSSGTFCGLITNNGIFSVTPRYFRNYGGHMDKRIIVSCKTNDTNVNNGDTLGVGRTLKFTLTGVGGVLEGNPIIEWEVCNSGYGKDDMHHEIYNKGKNEGDAKNQFTRDLIYSGTHLLRCKVVNRAKAFVQQVIFVVNGE